LDGADPGCGPPPPCPDADADGFADCTTDPTCDATGLTCGDCDDSLFDVNPGQKEKGGPKCNDGLDNDCNGFIDGADPDCQ
ncbi:MAG: hypothetical protein O6947_08145, partial [Acidobacteria bacterium]|nr:hypothetical protein [Acidobacteriota bacterium]